MTTHWIDDLTVCPRCRKLTPVPLSAALVTCGRCGSQWKQEPRERSVPQRRKGRAA